MRFGWSLALVMMLAGCAGDTPEAPATDEAAVDLEAERVARAPAGDAAGALLPDPIDVDWVGGIPVEACAPSGPNSCMGASVPMTGTTDDSLFLAAAPAAWSGTLTLTWSATSPATETLQLGLTFYKKCGGSCWESLGTDGAYVSGTSPLVLEVGGAAAPASAEGLWISVRQVRLTPDPVYAVASLGQEFHAEGRLEPAPTPPA
jgi:hypothetical protein